MTARSPPLALAVLGRVLRVRDNPSLALALRQGLPVLPVVVIDPQGGGGAARRTRSDLSPVLAAPLPVSDDWPSAGGAGRFWLHHSLHHLRADLAARGAALVVRTGDLLAVIRKVCPNC